MNTDFGYQKANRQSTNGENKDAVPITIYLGSLFSTMQSAQTALEQIKECPNTDGNCNDYMILFEDRLVVCPIFTSVETISDTKACPYAAKLARAFDETVKRTIADAGVPVRHMSRIGNHNVDANLRQAMQYNYRDFLLLCGPTGTGKSFAAAYLCYRWVVTRFLGIFKDRKKWGEIEKAVQEGIGWYTSYEAATATYQEQKEIAKKHRILVLDDLGIEDNSPRSVAGINYIVSKRYDYGEDMATIVTGNLSIDDISERYGKRLTDRFMENGQIIVYDGPVIRGNVKIADHGKLT